MHKIDKKSSQKTVSLYTLEEGCFRKNNTKPGKNGKIIPYPSRVGAQGSGEDGPKVLSEGGGYNMLFL